MRTRLLSSLRTIERKRLFLIKLLLKGMGIDAKMPTNCDVTDAVHNRWIVLMNKIRA